MFGTRGSLTLDIVIAPYTTIITFYLFSLFNSTVIPSEEDISISPPTYVLWWGCNTGFQTGVPIAVFSVLLDSLLSLRYTVAYMPRNTFKVSLQVL